MKNTFFGCIAIIGALFAGNAYAQQDSTRHDDKKKNSVSIEFGRNGLVIKHEDSTSKATTVYNHKKFENHWIMVDLGTNFMQDNTNYNSAATRNFLNVPDSRKNSGLFDLRQAKSINVNIYFWMGTWNVLRAKNQKISISTGVGLQLYNFRYDNPVTYTRNPSSVILDTTSFKKDKLAFDYLSVPLMVTFKTRISGKEWLVYGIGITGGYRIGSWTKQVSSEHGKVKVHDQFDFADFNSCLTGEIGINPGIRFYASYQLTSIYKDNVMDQRPVSVGIRISGI